MKTVKILPVVFGILAVLASLEIRAAEGPTVFIRTMLDEVMAVQNDPALQGPRLRGERRIAVKKIIGRSFDFDTMSKNALGNYRQKLGPEQQKEFSDVFRDLFQDSYTKLVLDFLKREKIVYGRENSDGEAAAVETTILRTNEKIEVHYSLNHDRGRWLIHDVAIDGASIVRNYRRSFARVIERESYPALLKRMRVQQKSIESASEKDREPRGKD
jgi:phospholipid transport system substrate-binding protein